MSTLNHRLEGPDQTILVVEAPRELDHGTADLLVGRFHRYLPNHDGAAAVLDLASVELISSIGVTAILQVRELCSDRGAQIMLARVPSRQLEFLKMLRLDRKFEIVQTVEDAVARIATEPG